MNPAAAFQREDGILEAVILRRWPRRERMTALDQSRHSPSTRCLRGLPLDPEIGRQSTSTIGLKLARGDRFDHNGGAANVGSAPIRPSPSRMPAGSCGDMHILSQS